MNISRGSADSQVISIRSSVWTSPTDATNRYYGGLGLGAASEGLNRIYIPKEGTVTAIYVRQLILGTLASTETSTISFRLNATTSTAITTSFQQDQASETFSNTGLSIAVVAGDFFELIWATPTWATNPTNVYIGAQVLFE